MDKEETRVAVRENNGCLPEIERDGGGKRTAGECGISEQRRERCLPEEAAAAEDSEKEGVCEED